MSRFRRARALLGAAVAAAVVGQACTVPGSEKPKPAGTAQGAVEGGTITVATLPPGPLDPVAATGEPARAVLSLLCDTLVRIDPKTGEVRPGIVETWKVSDGGGSIQLKLHRGMTFHDGRRVESRVIVDSLRRLVSPETASHLSDLLQPVAGYDAYRASVEQGEERPTALRGARVIEPGSFEILLDRPYPDFIRTLAHPATTPIDVAVARDDPNRFARSPECAGPYRLEQPYQPGDPEIRLQRRPDYQGSSPAYTRGGRGWAERIVFRVVPDEEAAYQAWVKGEVDVAPVPSGRLAEARRSHAGAVHSIPGSQVEYIGLPYAPESPFENDALRQALAAAVDRGRLAEEVYGGSRVPATGFLPPVTGEAYRPKACSFGPPAERPPIPPGPVPFYFNDEFSHRRLVEAVAAQWKQKLGIDIRPTPMNWDQYLQRATTGSGFDSAFRVSWSPRVVDPVAYLRPLVHSANIGGTNLERFSDVRVDEVLDKDILRATDDGDRTLLAQKLEDDLCRRLPLIPLVFGESHVLVRERVASARSDGLVASPHEGVLLRDLFTPAS